MRIDETNREMARAWDDESAHWTEQEAHYDAAVRHHTDRLWEAAGISLADHVLDIGCGTGTTTREAARAASSGSALGVDLSDRMIERALELARAEGLSNARFEAADAQVHPFARGAFDLAVSRFGAMFFGDPLAAFTNVAGALRPGGRLLLLAWQELKNNQWLVAVRQALALGRELPAPPVGSPGPFGLADPDGVRRILTGAGFEDIAFHEVRERVVLGTDVEDAFAFVKDIGPTHGLLDGLDDGARIKALGQLRTTLAAHHSGDGVRLDSSAWLISAGRASPP
jgi:SAM-dependent methyltransferase